MRRQGAGAGSWCWHGNWHSAMAMGRSLSIESSVPSLSCSLSPWKGVTSLACPLPPGRA